MRWVVLHQTTTSAEGAQGIHDISFILGVEATRDLEQEPFHGVGAIPSSVPRADAGY